MFWKCLHELLSKESSKIIENDIFDGITENRIYISKQFGSNKRLVHKIINIEKQHRLIKRKNEVILYEQEGKGGKYQLKALLIEDKKEIKRLIIQRFEGDNGKPHNFGFSFSGVEIDILYAFLKNIKELKIDTSNAFSMESKTE